MISNERVKDETTHCNLLSTKVWISILANSSSRFIKRHKNLARSWVSFSGSSQEMLLGNHLPQTLAGQISNRV